MKLIGMLDSPYVRRVAVSLDLLGVAFEHEAVSVFSHFERFVSLNPVVKAPTIIFDDGRVMMESSLILEYFESTTSASLWSEDAHERREQARMTSFALAATEKSVQAVYEMNLRRPDQQSAEWLKRMEGQRHAAFAALERELAESPLRFQELHQASITAAIAYQFAHSELHDEVGAESFPHLARHAERMENTEVFQKYPPIGPGVQASAQ